MDPSDILFPFLYLDFLEDDDKEEELEGGDDDDDDGAAPPPIKTEHDLEGGIYPRYHPLFIRLLPTECKEGELGVVASNAYRGPPKLTR